MDTQDQECQSSALTAKDELWHSFERGQKPMNNAVLREYRWKDGYNVRIVMPLRGAEWMINMIKRSPGLGVRCAARVSRRRQGPSLSRQELNHHHHPVYGCYVFGRFWNFMGLQERQYTISDAYVATRTDVFDIFRILRVVKHIISEFVTQDHATRHRAACC